MLGTLLEYVTYLPSILLPQAKIPDIEKCLDVVAALQAKKALGEVCIISGALDQSLHLYNCIDYHDVFVVEGYAMALSLMCRFVVHLN